MAFESLTEKLQNVFKNLRSKGRLTEADVKTALKEVKMALLEADVSFKVVKQFIKSVQEQAVGQDVMNGLNPGQMVIKIVNDELVKLMGSETTEIALRPGNGGKNSIENSGRTVLLPWSESTQKRSKRNLSKSGKQSYNGG